MSFSKLWHVYTLMKSVTMSKIVNISVISRSFLMYLWNLYLLLPLSVPRQPLTCFQSLLLSMHCLEFCMNGVIQCGFLYAWLFHSVWLFWSIQVGVISFVFNESHFPFTAWFLQVKTLSVWVCGLMLLSPESQLSRFGARSYGYCWVHSEICFDEPVTRG